MGGHAACWVKAKPNAFSGEKENAKVKIHLCGGVETGASCQTDSWPLPCYRFCSKLELLTKSPEIREERRYLGGGAGYY